MSSVHSGAMAALIHLVRHGEVHNPDHLVYGELPGFDLSSRGEAQAEGVADHLVTRTVVAVWSSPLERALRTAEVIAGRVGLPVRVHPDLVEWRLANRWAGTRWEDLPARFPGELEAYLEHPQDLSFSPETLEALATRMRRVLTTLHSRHPDGEVVMVSHQDPIQAGRLAVSGTALASLHRDKPVHAAVISLRPGTPWQETARWAPPESEPFPPLP